MYTEQNNRTVIMSSIFYIFEDLDLKGRYINFD